MAGAMRKVAVYLGLVEDQDRYEEDYDPAFDGEYDDHEPRESEPRRDDRGPGNGRDAGSGYEREATVSALPNRPQVKVAPDPADRSSHITTLHPRTYNDARLIGEHFRDGTPVIMNLTGMDDSDAKRLVDFAAGLIFGLHGSIERVTAKVFLLSPVNVTVKAEDKARIAEGGFFNQS